MACCPGCRFLIATLMRSPPAVWMRSAVPTRSPLRSLIWLRAAAVGSAAPAPHTARGRRAALSALNDNSSSRTEVPALDLEILFKSRFDGRNFDSPCEFSLAARRGGAQRLLSNRAHEILNVANAFVRR